MPKLGPRGKYKLTPTTSFKDGPNPSVLAPQGANPLESKNPDPLFTIAQSGQQLVMADLKKEQIIDDETRELAQPLPPPSDLQVRAKMEMPDEIRESGHPVDEINVANVDFAEEEQIRRKAQLDEEFKNNQYELMKLLLARLGGGPLNNMGGSGGIAQAQSSSMVPAPTVLPSNRIPATQISSPGPLATFQSSHRSGIPEYFSPIRFSQGPLPDPPSQAPPRPFSSTSGAPSSISATSPASMASQIVSAPPVRMANIFNLQSDPYGIDP